jgi:hypothetical protein
LVVSFLGQLVIESAGFYVTTALVHRLAGDADKLSSAPRQTRYLQVMPKQDRLLASAFSNHRLLSTVNLNSNLSIHLSLAGIKACGMKGACCSV